MKISKNLIAGLSACMLALTVSAFSAESVSAQDVSSWQPTTAAGGARVDPNYWTAQAAVRFNGGMGNQTNVTVAPTTNTFYDYSTPVTNVEGGQTNVTAVGNLTNGGTFTVQTGDTAFAGGSAVTNTSTNVTSTATLGSGRTVTTNTSSNNGSGPGI